MNQGLGSRAEDTGRAAPCAIPGTEGAELPNLGCLQKAGESRGDPHYPSRSPDSTTNDKKPPCPDTEPPRTEPRASVNVRTTHTARGFEVARAKMVAFGHPNHHTRQPVGGGGTAQCLWHSAVGTRGTAPRCRLSRAAEPGPTHCTLGDGPGECGSSCATASIWAPSIIALLILVTLELPGMRQEPV